MTPSRLVAVAAGAALVLTGCVANQPMGGASSASEVISVSASETACAVAPATAASGVVRFRITNNGPQTTEFYVLAADGLRVVAEKENIATGATSELSAQMQPGSYFTACKPGMRGENVGKAAFTVTGGPVQMTGNDQALLGQVVTKYVSFVKNEIAELQPQAAKLADAYAAGDDATARSLFATTRLHYERVEPIAEALGILDPRIDYREIDYKAEAAALAKDDPTFTQWLGFHRIEKDLWVPAKDALQPDGSPAWGDWRPSTPAERAVIAKTLVADIGRLYDTVHADNFAATHHVDLATVSNGASALLEEIATSKVTGEEDWWSHTDLYDFQGNLQGARIAFDLVAPVAEGQSEAGKPLVARIDTEFDKLQALLDSHGSVSSGFTSYDKVSRSQRRQLVEQIDATREPLSKLTNAVLGIEGGK
ncbi:MAG: hypothetical protein CVT62_11585 [Actinobacteria bacterium HGW-Actinobacteria-2]|nr:MAG: hypothetical protein CVT62_11585 [Actinobacteria bacterium HGW-Actinobacteria-2]